MTITPRLLVGISTTTKVDVTVSGTLQGNPDLEVLTATGGVSLKHDTVNHRWTAALDAGQYLLRIQAIDTAPAAKLTVSTSVEVTFAAHRQYDPKKLASTTKTWTGKEAESPGNSKDPWPPPSASAVDEPWFQWSMREAAAGLPREA